MNLFITYDANDFSRVKIMLNQLKNSNINDVFSQIKKLDKLEGFGLFFICRDNKLNFKQRVKLVKKNKELFVDIVLDYNKIMLMNNDNKFQYLANEMVNQLIIVLEKYKFKGFDIDSLKLSLTKFFKESFSIDLNEA